MAGGLGLLVAVMMMNGMTVTDGKGINFMAVQVGEVDREMRLMSLPNLPELVDQLGLSELYSAVIEASLGETLSAKGPFTLFAPTNKAFKMAPYWLKHALKNVTILTEVLKYHVLSGKVPFSAVKDELTVNTLEGSPIRFNIYPNNNVTTAQCAPIDVRKVNEVASNGLLHELQAVMVPPYGNIVETASAIKAFSTLVNALAKAGLVDKLKGKGPFTVFAPTDAAFRKLDPKTLDDLLKNKTKLTDVLLYHVASLTYCKAGLVSYKTLKMLNNQSVDISVDCGKVKVNNANVVPMGTDGSVTNGVIHVIDTVLFPPSFHHHH